MKISKSLFCLALAGLLLTSCSKHPKCAGGDMDKGVISKSIGINCSPVTGNQFIITSDSAYRETFEHSCDLPSIDFNTHSLLGLYARGECQVKFIREVNQDETELKYHYKVIVNECGMCKSIRSSYNWVTVPKLQDGWSVTFETKKD